MTTAVFGAFGIYVCSGDEDDVTVPTQIWDPVDDARSDWVYRFIGVWPAGSTANTIATNGGADTVVESLAKRKIPRGSGVMSVFQTFGDGGVDMAADVRILLISG